jgi:hypothetical protein
MGVSLRPGAGGVIQGRGHKLSNGSALVIPPSSNSHMAKSIIYPLTNDPGSISAFEVDFQAEGTITNV